VVNRDGKRFQISISFSTWFATSIAGGSHASAKSHASAHFSTWFTGASGLPYNCAPLIYVSDVIELLAVLWNNNQNKETRSRVKCVYVDTLCIIFKAIINPPDPINYLCSLTGK